MDQEQLERIVLPSVQEFITRHAQDDVRTLALRHRAVDGVPFALIADQIAGHQKARHKIPSYASLNRIVYPPSINLEQCSSEITARFKSELIKSLTLDSAHGIDLTGGFGVDATWFAPVFNRFDFVEPHNPLLIIARHNHEVLGLQNITYHSTSAESFIASTQSQVDFVFVDPSRRSGSSKVYRLADCFPDVTILRNSILEISPVLLIKASPLLDILEGARELERVSAVHVVAVDNECREVLFVSTSDSGGDFPITAHNLASTSGRRSDAPFCFTKREELESPGEHQDPDSYIYEPNAAILKAGAFKSVATRFGIKKLAPSTHFYTSNSLIKDFPGRIFRLEEAVTGNRKPPPQANIVTRNYPLTPDQLKKKLKLSDGGDVYVLGFSGQTKKHLFIASRVQ